MEIHSLALSVPGEEFDLALEELQQKMRDHFIND